MGGGRVVADVAVVIPAYNEAPRVGAVVRAALLARQPRRVVVVDDGSRDGTAEVARAAGAEVLRQGNRGKARAMDAGARHVLNAGLCFLDADLVGLTASQIDGLIEPWTRGAKMVVGMDQPVQHIFWSIFAGPRVLSRIAWIEVVALEPSMLDSGYGVEITLAAIANRYRWPVAEVPLDGIRAPNQAAKWGGSNALRSIRMWGQIVQAAGRVSRGRVIEELFGPALRHHGFVNRVNRRGGGSWLT